MVGKSKFGWTARAVIGAALWAQGATLPSRGLQNTSLGLGFHGVL
jgi:hypothetical protein